MTDKPAPARSEPRRAEEKGVEHPGCGYYAATRNGIVFCNKCGYTADAPAPSPEPQEEELPYAYFVELAGEGAQHVIKSKDYIQERDAARESFASLMRTWKEQFEALRVAEERAEKAESDRDLLMRDTRWEYACDHEHLAAALADSERKREEAVALLYESHINDVENYYTMGEHRKKMPACKVCAHLAAATKGEK